MGQLNKNIGMTMSLGRPGFGGIKKEANVMNL
jgi:hypothetical protein